MNLLQLSEKMYHYIVSVLIYGIYTVYDFYEV